MKKKPGAVFSGGETRGKKKGRPRGKTAARRLKNLWKVASLDKRRGERLFYEKPVFDGKNFAEL